MGANNKADRNEMCARTVREPTSTNNRDKKKKTDQDWNHKNAFDLGEY